MPKLGFIARLIGDSNEKELKRLSSIVDEINTYAEETAALSDELVHLPINFLICEAFPLYRSAESVACEVG